MPNRLFQLVALVILIGAPVIANLISKAVPDSQHMAPAANEGAPVESVAEDAPPPSPPAVNPPMEAMAPPVDGNVTVMTDITPSLDPHGIEPAATGEVESVATQLAATQQEPPP